MKWTHNWSMVLAVVCVFQATIHQSEGGMSRAYKDFFERELTLLKKTVAKPGSCPSQDRMAEVVNAVEQAPAPESLWEHTKEFVKQRIEVIPGVHVFIGYAMANSIIIEAPEGLIVVDTLDGYASAKKVVSDLRAAGVTKPFKALVYTHNHPDHIGGSKAFLEGNPEGVDVEVWSYKTTEQEFWGKFKYNRGLILRRSLRMFGVQLGDALINSGLGASLHSDEGAGLMPVPPNRKLNNESTAVKIAGLQVQLIHIPGETRDQMALYVPSKKVMCPGDDIYTTYPNLYSIRGTPPRPVENWMQSLDKILQYDVEYVLPSHTRPIRGKENVISILTKYRDGIQYTFDQTIRLMNKGLHPDEVAQSIVLPPSLRNERHLLEHYGTVEWSSKTIFEGQLGWFSGYPEELYPLTPKVKAERWVKLVGEEKMLDAAENALNGWKEDDIKWGLWLVTQVWYTVKESTDSTHLERARDLRTRALIELASLQTSPNGRNYLLTWVYEENCVVNSNISIFTEADAISSIPIELVVRKLGTLLIPERVIDRTEKVKLHFSDSDVTYVLELRNSVLDTKKVVDGQCTEDIPFDLDISVTEEEFRKILNRKMTFVSSSATVLPSAPYADWFFKYFEDPSIPYY